MGTSSVADPGAPKRLWKTRERVGSYSSEAAECPPCAHTPSTHPLPPTGFSFSLWTFMGAQEGGGIECKETETLPTIHDSAGPEGTHKTNPRAGGKGEKCRHLLRERVALFSLNVLRALRWILSHLPMSYCLLVFPKMLPKTSPPCFSRWLPEVGQLETRVSISPGQ